MNIKMGVVSAGLILILSSPTMAAELYCISNGTMNWIGGRPHVVHQLDQDAEWTGGKQIWVDTETGDFRERTTGTRALYNAGGTYTVHADGSGYRQHWVGLIDHGGFDSLRLDLRRDPIAFLGADRMGSIEVGTCIETNGRRFIDGRGIAQ